MKKLLCCLAGLLPLAVAAQEKVEELNGLRQIRCSSANVNAICEADGLLFFALQQGVQVYLQDQFIGYYSYNHPESGIEIGRKDEIELLPNRDSHRVHITFKDECIGSINYLEGRMDTTCRQAGREAALDNSSFRLKPAKEGGYYLCSNKGDTLFSKPVWDVVENKFRSGEDTIILLAATVDGSLYELKVSGAKVVDSLKYQLNLPYGGKADNVRALAYLEEGHTILIGTIGEHVLLWPQKQQDVFRSWLNTGGLKTGGFNHFWSTCRVDDRYYLAGNDIGHVLLMDVRSNQMIDSRQLEMQGGQVRSIVRIAENSFLAGTDKGAIWKIELKNGSFDRVAKMNLGGEKNIGSIYALITLPQKGVFVGTSKGLFLLDSGTEFIGGLEMEIPVQFISPDKAGNGWFYGGKKGLWYRNREQDSGIAITHKELEGANISYVLDITSREEGSKIKTLLICTRDRYFFHVQWDAGRNEITAMEHFDAEKGMIHYAGSEAGNYQEMRKVYGGVDMEKSGTAWLSTDFGLVAFDYRDKKLAFYDQQATGLWEKEFNTGGFHLQDDSTAVFASLKGLLRVNGKKAREYLKEKRVEPQLWEVLNSTYSAYLGNRIFRKLNFQEVRLDYEDDERQFFIVAPDYSMLSRNAFTRIVGKDTITIFDDRILPAQGVFGKFQEGSFGNIISLLFNTPWVGTLSLQSGIGVLSINFRQSVSRAKRASILLAVVLIAAILILIAAIFIWYYYRKSNKAKQALQDEQNRYLLRQQLFTQLGDKLDKADGYPGIQAAFQTITKEEMRGILNATKISLYRYQQRSRTLQLIGHSDAAPLEGEDNSRYEEVGSVVFDIDAEDNYPVAHLWNHREKYKRGEEDYCLVVNQAKAEFYQANGLSRPAPKRGKPTESFLFLLIGGNIATAEPFGVIAIQNEQAGAFENETSVEQYIFLLKQIGRLAYFKVGEIEQRVLKNAFEGRNILYRNRLEAHFISGIHDAPFAILKSNGDEISLASKQIISMLFAATRGFFSKIYEMEFSCSLRDEIDLCRRYLDLKQQTLIGIQIDFSDDIAENAKGKIVPSLMLLNIVHNAYKYARISKREKIIIQIEAAYSEEKGLMITVTDNADGFSQEARDRIEIWRKTRSVSGRKSSLFTIMETLDAMESTFGGNAEIDFKNAKPIGTGVTLTFSSGMLKQYQLFTKKLNKDG